MRTNDDETRCRRRRRSCHRDAGFGRARIPSGREARVHSARTTRNAVRKVWVVFLRCAPGRLPRSKAQIPEMDFAQNGQGPATGKSTVPRAVECENGSECGAPQQRNRTSPARPVTARLKYLASSHLGWPSHDLLALLRGNYGFRERIQRYITGKELFQHRPQYEYPLPFKRRFVEIDGDFQAASERDGPGCLDPPQHRAAAHRAQSVDLFEHLAIARIGIDLKKLSQSFRAGFATIQQ